MKKIPLKKRFPYIDTERQGNGRRYWFLRRRVATAFATDRRKVGHAVIVSEFEPEYPNQTPSVWVGPRKRSRATRAYLSGVDTLVSVDSF